MNKANKWLIGTVSATLLSGVAYLEGTKYKPYKDIGGVPTVCMGHTGKDVDMDKLYTDAECRALAIKDLQLHSTGVLQCINVPIKQNEYDAYTLFAFNVGVAGFCGSRALKLLNAGQEKESCVALARDQNGKPVWSYVNNVFSAGLYKRRQFESAMCLGDSQ